MTDTTASTVAAAETVVMLTAIVARSEVATSEVVLTGAASGVGDGVGGMIENDSHHETVEKKTGTLREVDEVARAARLAGREEGKAGEATTTTPNLSLRTCPTCPPTRLPEYRIPRRSTVARTSLEEISGLSLLHLRRRQPTTRYGQRNHRYRRRGRQRHHRCILFLVITRRSSQNL